MTLEEIDAKLFEMRAQKDALIVELKALVAKRDSLAKLEEMRQKVEGMSDADKRALSQVIRPAGIVSGAKVNGQ